MKENEGKGLKSSLLKRMIKRAPESTSASEKADKPAETEEAQDASAKAGARLDASPDSHWPISITGAFIGMLAGTLPASICALIFGSSFSPLYMLLPLCVYYGIKLLRGSEGIRGLILTVIFSLLGLYLTALSCQAAVDVMRFKMRFKMSVFNLPLVTIAMIGKSGMLPSPAISSANVFPIIFTAIGVLLTYEMLISKKKPKEMSHDEAGETASDE